jgi:hypothetical protein
MDTHLKIIMKNATVMIIEILILLGPPGKRRREEACVLTYEEIIRKSHMERFKTIDKGHTFEEAYHRAAND